MRFVRGKILIAAMLAVILSGLILSGCANEINLPTKSEEPMSEQPTSEATPEQTFETRPVSSQSGTTQRFVYGGLSLEVSNVREVKQGSLYDGSDTCEYEIYEVYPGATMTILDADTWINSEDGLTYSEWAIYTSSDEKIYIVDDMEPIEITPDILNVFDPESSLAVLTFEICEEY